LSYLYNIDILDMSWSFVVQNLGTQSSCSVMIVVMRCTVQCPSADDNEDDVADDMEVFNDCDEQVPVVRPIPQSYMIRPPADTRPFPADTATSRAQPPPSYSDGKSESEHTVFQFGCNLCAYDL